MRRVITLVVGILLSAAGFAGQAQIPPSTAIQAPKSAAQASSAVSAASAEKPAKVGTRKSASVAASTASEETPEPKVARRDPFESLIGREKANAEMAKNLPPGKAGLQVASLRLDGIVKAPSGMIAVVTNPQARTYFLREGDQLYDGRVEKIAMDGVSFHEIGKDAFGKPVERQVNKRIYSSAGEQQ